MPMRHELSFSARSQTWDRSRPQGTARPDWSDIVRELHNPDLQAILIFALFGLLVSLALALFAPFSAEITAALGQI